MLEDQPVATGEINVVFEGPEIGEGVPLQDLNKTLQSVQRAVRLMAAYSAGVGIQGRPPEWLRQQSSLWLRNIFPGSFGATLALPLSESRPDARNYGSDALDAILGWNGDEHSLPGEVVKCLNSIAFGLSSHVQQVRLGDPYRKERNVVIERKRRERRESRHSLLGTMEAETLLYGRLLEVNWNNGTAQLHSYGEKPVDLRFAPSLNEAMHELATRYVKVVGIGRFNRDDEWETVTVNELTAEHSELDAFRAREPKFFDPARATSYYRHDNDDPIDIEEFIHIIYEGRDA